MSAVRVASVHYEYARPRRRRAVEAMPPALDGVILDVAEGTWTGLLGPNGSGKSTLLRLVAGVASPKAGAVEIFGHVAGTPAAAALTGVAFQSPSLDPRLTVRENLACHAALHGLDAGMARGRADVLLEQAGLREHADRIVRTLSGGLARRVDLIRALLPEPRLLLLDEPTVGLDPTARAAFMSQVRESVRAFGVTALLSTHLTEEAQQCDRVVLMHRGRIVADGSPHLLRGELGPRVITVETPNPPDFGEPSRWRRRGDAWAMEPRDASEMSELLSRLVEVEAPVTVAPPTLADLFERLTGADLESKSGSAVEGSA